MLYRMYYIMCVRWPPLGYWFLWDYEKEKFENTKKKQNQYHVEILEVSLIFFCSFFVYTQHTLSNKFIFSHNTVIHIKTAAAFRKRHFHIKLFFVYISTYTY